MQLLLLLHLLEVLLQNPFRDFDLKLCLVFLQVLRLHLQDEHGASGGSLPLTWTYRKPRTYREPLMCLLHLEGP